MNVKKQVAGFLLILTLLFWNSSSWAVYYSWTQITDFKGIDKYSLFLKGNLRYYRSDIEGRAAVGGNAYLKGFSIGEKAGSGEYSLVVGGKLKAGGPGDNEGGQVNNGGIYSGREAKLNRVGLPEGDIVSGSRVIFKNMTVEDGSVMARGAVKLKNADIKKDVISGGKIILKDSTIHGNKEENSGVSVEPPIRFEDIDLFDISSSVLKKDENAAESIENGELLLECNDPLICYFNISASQIENAWGIKINASVNKTVVLNVKGSAKKLTIADKAFSLLGGIRSTNILYNFFGFDKIIMHNIGLKGSILAPGATVKFSEGNMEGALMAQNFVGGSWKKHINGGQINAPLPVPEPATFVLLFTGLFLLLGSWFLKLKSRIVIRLRS